MGKYAISMDGEMEIDYLELELAEFVALEMATIIFAANQLVQKVLQVQFAWNKEQVASGIHIAKN